MRRRARKRRARTEALEYARHRRRIFLSIPALFLRRPARELLPDLLLLPDSRIAASGHSRKKCFRSRRSETSPRGRSRVFTEKPPDGRSAGGNRHGQQSRLLRPCKVCRPAYGVLAGRYFQTQYARTASHAFRFSAALPAPAPRRRGACCGVPASRAGTAARPVLARIHRSRLFSTDLTRRFCVSPFLL